MVIYIVNGLIAAAVIVGVILGKVTWVEASALVIALLVPSAAAHAGRQVARARATKRAIAIAQKAAPPLALFALVTLGFGCTKQEAADATKITADILCAIEHAELDDPSLNQVCGVLTAAEMKAVQAHRASLARAVAKSKTVCSKDAGP